MEKSKSESLLSLRRHEIFAAKPDNFAPPSASSLNKRKRTSDTLQAVFDLDGLMFPEITPSPSPPMISSESSLLNYDSDELLDLESLSEFSDIEELSSVLDDCIDNMEDFVEKKFKGLQPCDLFINRNAIDMNRRTTSFSSTMSI